MEEQILNKLEIIEKRITDIEKYTELIWKDREIIEEVRSSQEGLKQAVYDYRNHVDNLICSVQSDIKIQGIKTEGKLDDTQDKIDETQDKLQKTTQKVEEIKKAII